MQPENALLLSPARSRDNVETVPRPRKTTPFTANPDAQPDERVHERLWELPQRIERANAAGPRYNQTQLAHKMGVTQSVVSKLASGSTLYGVRLGTIYALSEALNVSVAWLLGESDTLAPAPPRRKKRRQKKRRTR